MEVSENAHKSSLTRDVCLMSATIQFLLLRNMRDLTALLERFEKLFSSQDGRESHLSRYVGFSFWLVKICQRGGESTAKLFQWLCGSFRHETQFDKAWGAEVPKIGKTYFNIQPPPNMMDMLSSMLGGGGGGK